MDLSPLWAYVALMMASVMGTAPAVRTSLPPPSTALSAPAGSHCPDWYGVALDAGWDSGDWPTLDRIMWCESKCQPTAHNRSGASGLMQIMPMWHHGRDAYDPAVNLVMALEVKQLQGWRAWSCY